MQFNQRSRQKELLDRVDIPFKDIQRNMYELNIINSLLGGHRITLKGIQNLLNAKVHSLNNNILTVCEVGCGGGDNLKVVKHFLDRQNIKAHFIGIDINPFCTGYARSVIKEVDFEWITSDYRNVHFRIKPDIIFTSLFCHHFSDEDLVDMFRWLKSNSGRGFFINDLHRHPLAYYSIKWLTAFLSKSYLVKNDAPLSIKRGFIRKELVSILQKAGILNYHIEWKWAFRWLISVHQ